VRQKALVVGDKTERVYRFHENTLIALQELVQAAGLKHPNQITASHIVRRTAHGVTLLAQQLPHVAAGELLAGKMPHNVFTLYWPLARSDSFEPALGESEEALNALSKGTPLPVTAA
jgi:hypothetical protein